MLNVVNRPASECCPNRIHLGPTSPDFSMVASPVISDKEKAMVKQWKTEDLATYYRQQRR